MSMDKTQKSIQAKMGIHTLADTHHLDLFFSQWFCSELGEVPTEFSSCERAPGAAKE